MVTADRAQAPSNDNSDATGKVRYAVVPCSLGQLLVARNERGVCAILLGDDPDTLAHELQKRFAGARRAEAVDRDFEALVSRVVARVESPASGVDFPLDVRGTAFQQRVWEALRRIPAGETLTYGELARRLGQPKAARAVASACGANPLAVVIPCHRIVAADGSLGGYRWGLTRKRALLDREAASQSVA